MRKAAQVATNAEIQQIEPWGIAILLCDVLPLWGGWPKDIPMFHCLCL